MKKFYDIHMHVMDLSHPNLSAFLFKDDLLKSFINWKTRLAFLLAPIGAVLPERYIVKQMNRIINKNIFVKNTLSFYEIPLEYQFLLLDYFLKKPNRVADTMVDSNNEFCFAHFGSQQSGSNEWRKSIIGLTQKENVYTDSSCNDSFCGYYETLNKTIKDSNVSLRNRVLFGSDFSINMFASKMESYNQYLKVFIQSGQLKYKQELCMDNPEAYLFGKSL